METLMPIEQKMVDFNGAELMAVKATNGKIYGGVKWICDGIGLSDGQFRRQKQNISTDAVLQKGITNLRYPTSGGPQEALCIEVDYLPLWLAKISITPKMKVSNPTLTDKLVEYQLKAKDVLAKAFLDGVEFRDVMPKTFSQALRMLADKIDENEALTLTNTTLIPKAEKFDTFMTAINAQKMNDVAKSLGKGRNKFFAYLRGQGVLMRNNVPYQKYINAGYFEVKDKPILMGSIVVNKPQTFVTPKGISYLADLIKNDGK